MIASVTYHVTRVVDVGLDDDTADVFGHADSHCDPCGCNGHERYLGRCHVYEQSDNAPLPHCERGDLIEIDYDDAADPRGEIVDARIVEP